MKLWPLLCLVTLAITGCLGIYGGGPYLAPGSISSSFDDVKVLVNSGQLSMIVHDNSRNLQNLRVISASYTDKRGIQKLSLLRISKQATSEDFHTMYLVFTPAPAFPFDLNIVMSAENKMLMIQAHYSGLEQGSFTSWKNL